MRLLSDETMSLTCSLLPWDELTLDCIHFLRGDLEFERDRGKKVGDQLVAGFEYRFVDVQLFLTTSEIVRGMSKILDLEGTSSLDWTC